TRINKNRGAGLIAIGQHEYQQPPGKRQGRCNPQRQPAIPPGTLCLVQELVEVWIHESDALRGSCRQSALIVAVFRELAGSPSEKRPDTILSTLESNPLPRHRAAQGCGASPETEWYVSSRGAVPHACLAMETLGCHTSKKGGSA